MGSEMIHVLLVSFTTQGHVNPFLRLAKRMASIGLHVTFSSTTEVGHKIRTSTKTSAATADQFMPVGKGYLRFEFFSDGWEHNDPRKLNLGLYMPQLERVGTVAVAKLIRRQAESGRPVSCVVNNPFIPGVLDVAADMGIPCGMLWVQSCAVFSAYYHYYHKLVEFPSAEKPDLSVTLPGVATLRTDEIPTFLLHTTTAYPFLTVAVLAQIQNLSRATWVFVNSFEELENDVIHAMSPLTQLIPVGPLVDAPEEAASTRRTIKGDLFEAASGCMEWLDCKAPKSVVYVSVGSVVEMNEAEMAEMAWGLQNCDGASFLWVVRDDARRQLPEGFEDGTRDKGMIVKWSPQDRVLVHPSLACFLTHCGWNSTLECLTSGVPVVTLPHWGDQPMDANFLVDVYGVGVHLRDRSTNNNNSSSMTSFTREDVVRAVEEVTEGPRALEMRNNAAKYKEAARAAMSEGGSADRNIQAFLEGISFGRNPNWFSMRYPDRLGW